MRACNPSQAIRFGFERVILDHGHSVAEGIGYPARSLLHNVGQFMAEQKLAVRGVRIVLSGREVQIGSPGKSDGPDGRRLGSYVHAYVGEAGAKGRLHLRLHIPRQRPAAGPWTEIHLKGVHAGTVLDCRLRLDCAGVRGGERKWARLEESLNHSAAAAQRRNGHPDWLCRNRSICRRRCHAKILRHAGMACINFLSSGERNGLHWS